MLPCDVGSNRGCRAASATANQVGQRCRMAATQPWRQLLRFTDAPLLAAQRPVPPCPCPEPARAATRHEADPREAALAHDLQAAPEDALVRALRLLGHRDTIARPVVLL